MKYAHLWACPECHTVVATDAELDQEPTECGSCGHTGHFLNPRLSYTGKRSEEKEEKLSRSGAGPGWDA